MILLVAINFPSYLEVRGLSRDSQEVAPIFLSLPQGNATWEDLSICVEKLAYSGYFSDVHLEKKPEGGYVLFLKERGRIKKVKVVSLKKGFKVRDLEDVLKPQEKSEAPSQAPEIPGSPASSVPSVPAQPQQEDNEERVVIKKGDIYSDGKAWRAAFLMRKKLVDKGYYLARVTPRFRKGVLTFEVSPGPKVVVMGTYFPDARSFSEKQLREIIKTKPKFFIIRSGILKDENLVEDVMALRTFYWKAGFARVEVFRPRIEFTGTGKIRNAYITYPLKEGKRYTVASIKIVGAPKVFSVSEIKKEIKTRVGEPFNLVQFVMDVATVSDMYAQNGYLYAQVIPDVVYEGDKVHLKLIIYQEGIKVSIEKIVIEGAHETKDWVIKRTILFKEGDVFNSKKVRQSQVRLYQLGFFDEVKIYPRRGSSYDRVVLVIKVKERRTKTLSAGGGYSSSEGLMIFGQFSGDNLFGTAKRLAFKIEASAKGNPFDPDVEKKLNFEESYSDPWFFKTYFSFGQGSRHTTYQRLYSKSVNGVLTSVIYNQREVGGYLSFGRRLWTYNRVFLKYEYLWTHKYLDEPPADPNQLLLYNELEGIINARPVLTRSSLTLTVNRDTRNHPFFPSSGIYTGISLQYAGLGGDVVFLKPYPWFSVFHKLFWKLYSSFQVKTGWIFFPDWLPGDIKNGILLSRAPNDSFWLGGAESVRGYDDFSIRPPLADSVLDDMNYGLGGTAFFQTNFELYVPFLQGMVKVALFLDGGRIWTDPCRMLPDLYRWNYRVLKYGFGVGVRLDTPMGPLRFDYGWPFYFDDSGNFHLGTETNPGWSSGKFHFSIGGVFY